MAEQREDEKTLGADAAAVALAGSIASDTASHVAPFHEHHCGGSSWFGHWSNGGRCQWCGAVLPIAFGSGTVPQQEHAATTRRSAAPDVLNSSQTGEDTP